MATFPAFQARKIPGTVLPEDLRIQEGVVYSSVQDVNPNGTANRAQKQAVLIDEEVATLYQLDSHLVSQEAVLEIGRVVNAGREHGNHCRVAQGAQGGKDPAKSLRVGIDREDGLMCEQIWKDTLRNLTVFQHVGNT